MHNHTMERLVFFLLSIFTISFSSSLSLDLVHRDEHLLLSDPNISHHALFHSRLLRDLHRVPSLASSSANSSVFSGIPQGSGEYFTRIGVGTPANLVSLVIDTGSDVTWIQCAPCDNCYEQSDSIFDSKSSTTYNNISCASPLCQMLDESSCDSRADTCRYQVTYGDGSYTSGDFSSETLTFRKSEVAGVAIGCGHDNEGLFAGAGGLLGLGRGKSSFVIQSERLYDRKFSYCLAGRLSKTKSSILFGDTSVSRNARFTPMLTNPKHASFYFLNLTGISVGGSLVGSIKHSVFKIQEDGRGGVMLDSGTVITWLEKSAYVALRDAYRKRATGMKRTSGFLNTLDTCFDLSSGRRKVLAPAVALHFEGGVRMRLPVQNSLVEVDDNHRFCLAFAPMKGLSIIGNIQQQGFRISYDLKNQRIGLTAKSC